MDHAAQQVQAEGFGLGRADPAQGESPHPGPKPAQLSPVVQRPLWVARLAPGHFSQAAQHVRPSFPSSLLRQELVQDSEQGEQLAAGQNGRILGGKHSGDLQPERRTRLSEDRRLDKTASSDKLVCFSVQCF